jgi:hypothetical protein
MTCTSFVQSLSFVKVTFVNKDVLSRSINRISDIDGLLGFSSTASVPARLDIRKPNNLKHSTAYLCFGDRCLSTAAAAATVDEAGLSL